MWGTDYTCDNLLSQISWIPRGVDWKFGAVLWAHYRLRDVRTPRGGWEYAGSIRASLDAFPCDRQRGQEIDCAHKDWTVESQKSLEGSNL